MTDKAPYVTSRGIGWVHTDSDDGPLVHVARLPNGPLHILADTSALIWLAAVEGTSDVVAEVAEACGLPQETIRQDVETFVAELVERGLLRRA